MNIQTLETKFSAMQLPAGELRLSACETILDVPAFIDSHLTVLKCNPGNKRFVPYYDRLLRLYEILKNNVSLH